MTTFNADQCRRGGKARMARLRERLQAQGLSLSDYQRQIRARVSAEACRSNGAKGAAATLAKHGYAALHAKVVAYRLAHPSRPERQVMALLDELDLSYQREYEPFTGGPWQYTTLDFFLPGFGCCGKAIQVNGKVHNGEALFNPDGQRPQREAERLAAVRQAGIPVLLLDQRDMDVARERIGEFLTGGTQQVGL